MTFSSRSLITPSPNHELRNGMNGDTQTMKAIDSNTKDDTEHSSRPLSNYCILWKQCKNTNGASDEDHNDTRENTVRGRHHPGGRSGSMIDEFASLVKVVTVRGTAAGCDPFEKKPRILFTTYPETTGFAQKHPATASPVGRRTMPWRQGHAATRATCATCKKTKKLHNLTRWKYSK